MSGGGAIEVIGMSFGVSGLYTMVEKSLALFRVIGAAKYFANDASEAVLKLRFEYFRYSTWVQEGHVLSSLGNLRVDDPATRALPSNIPALDSPASSIKSTIFDAITQICSVLDTVDKLLTKYSRAFEPCDDDPNVMEGIRESLTAACLQGSESASRLRKLQNGLQNKIPYRRKILYSTPTWKPADKEQLEKLIANLNYWNNGLYSLIPLPRRSMLETEVSAKVVGRTNNTEELARIGKAANSNDYKSIRKSANFKALREQTTIIDPIDLRKEYDDILIPPNLRAARRFSTTYRPKDSDPQQVIVEWYYSDENWTREELDLANQRAAGLAHTFSIQNKPESLRVLDCLGYICHPKNHARAILYVIPPGVSTPSALQPVSLYQALSKDFRMSPPTLAERFRLATLLSIAFLELCNVGWLHKMFNSHNVLFFSDENSNLDYANPYILGFAFSRPDERYQKSLPARDVPLGIYRHPDLRSLDPTSAPRYKRKHDIYSLGMVLFEIAFWKRLDTFDKKNLSAGEFRDRIKGYTERDVGMLMGKGYQAAVRNCISEGALVSRPIEPVSLDLPSQNSESEDEGTEAESAVENERGGVMLNEYLDKVVSLLDRCHCVIR